MAAVQGVRAGMPVAEAQALVRELSVAPHDRGADRRGLEKLAEACEQFTPRVALEEGEEPECLLLDVSNLEHLHGSERQLAAQLKNFFTRRGYRVQLATGPTVGLAWALAHFDGEPASAGGQQAEDCKSETKLLTLHPRPSTFDQLPVEALRISHDTAALLRQLGIHTVGQLQSLPREDLATRFGEELLGRLDQFTGAAEEILQPHRGLPALKAACPLEAPTADRETILHVLAHLVERLARQLAARDQGAVLLVCTLHCAAAPVVSLRIGLVEPSANPRQLLELIELHLETLRLADEVDRIELHAAVVGRLGQRQRELFAERWPTDPHQLAVLVNRLSSRLGHERVLRAELRASPVPERAVRLVPMTAGTRGKAEGGGRKVQGKRNSSMAPPSPFRLPPSTLPLLLHPRPQPLEVVCIAPDGPPQFVWLENRRERIVRCTGPERIETLWWRGPSVRRDYYRVATESGGHLWIFRRLTDARWFLHGAFQ